MPLLGKDRKCQREKCTWNEYSREANEPTAEPKEKKNKGRI
jgi:hypothetical protein